MHKNDYLKSEIVKVSTNRKKNSIAIYELGNEHNIEAICGKIKHLLEVDMSPNHIN